MPILAIGRGSGVRGMVPPDRRRAPLLFQATAWLKILLWGVGSPARAAGSGEGQSFLFVPAVPLEVAVRSVAAEPRFTARRLAADERTWFPRFKP